MKGYFDGIEHREMDIDVFKGCWSVLAEFCDFFSILRDSGNWRCGVFKFRAASVSIPIESRESDFLGIFTGFGEFKRAFFEVLKIVELWK